MKDQDEKPQQPQQPRQPRQELADELAASLDRPEGLRALRLAELQGLLGGGEAKQPSAAGQEAPTGPRPISLWHPRNTEEGLVFERPRAHALGDHHAVQRRLAARAAPRTSRVCFFGESAAAGYLFAPHLTPALLLEEQLCRSADGEAWEVIDLARTNETLTSLASTVEAALQLAPDILVIFAGNNWTLLETPEISPYVPSTAARQRVGVALRSGLEGAVRLAQRERRRAVTQAVARIAGVAERGGIPVVWMVPEVSLADWHNRQPVPWLPGDGIASWHRALELGQAALAVGEAEQAAALAAEMRRLDRGLVPTSFRLEAEALRLLGREVDAAELCRSEVAAQHYPLLCHLGSPQANRGDQELLRVLCRLHGFACVDLPAIFAEHTASPLPGRRLFLDYCHLTAEGMHVAMAAATAAVLRRGRGLAGQVATEAPWWKRLVDELPPPAPSASAVATACLGAAVHSAHRLLTVGGKREILEHWSRAALDASAGVADAMLDLIEARCSPLPAVLTAAQQRNLASPYRLQLQHGWRWPGLDPQLLLALRTVLVERLGPPVGERIDGLVRASRGAEANDLLNARWHWEPVERFLADAMELDDLDGRAVYRSPWPSSSFSWVKVGEGAGRLELTARLPPAFSGRTDEALVGREGAAAEEQRGMVEVEVGGRVVARLEAGSRWKHWEIEVPAAMIRPGLNRLTLRWPLPRTLSPAADESDDPLAVVSENLENGFETTLHPIFGELFLLRTEG